MPLAAAPAIAGALFVAVSVLAMTMALLIVARRGRRWRQRALEAEGSAAKLRAGLAHGRGEVVLPERSHDGLVSDSEPTNSLSLDRRRQLEGAVAELAIARDLAEAAGRVKSNFLRMMSHEVRTPIAALDIHLGALVMHANEQLDPQARTHVQGIGRASTRLIEIVETVVEWARIDAGRFHAKAAPFSLVELAHDVVKDFAAHAELKGLELRVLAPDDELPPLVNDRAIARLIGVNLVGNAVKYTPRGSVLIHVERRGDLQIFRVEDTGAGIAPADHQAVFEPFRQLEDVGHSHGTGSGLGLSIVRDLVEAIGGKIELDSALGLGTRLTVALPMLEPAGAPTEVIANVRG